MKFPKEALLTTSILSTLPLISVYASSKIVVSDLGPHPILMLLFYILIGGFFWFIGYKLHNSTNSGCFCEILGNIIGYIGGAMCIGSLISIPINLLLMGYWWIILILVATFFIAVYIINKLD